MNVLADYFSLRQTRWLLRRAQKGAVIIASDQEKRLRKSVIVGKNLLYLAIDFTFSIAIFIV